MKTRRTLNLLEIIVVVVIIGLLIAAADSQSHSSVTLTPAALVPQRRRMQSIAGREQSGPWLQRTTESALARTIRPNSGDVSRRTCEVGHENPENDKGHPVASPLQLVSVAIMPFARL